ncbi:hypothetical protein ARTHRO9AX_120053 [Arthrobacter sp. 9AX]|nr:hypothetical protein ARTHRO9AX_120053 [Arthrobacter sp. 9AX]
MDLLSHRSFTVLKKVRERIDMSDIK